MAELTLIAGIDWTAVAVVALLLPGLALLVGVVVLLGGYFRRSRKGRSAQGESDA